MLATYYNHGIQNSSYFQGQGTESYDNVATGIGETVWEAFQDALEIAAQSESAIDIDQLEKHLARYVRYDNEQSESVSDHLAEYSEAYSARFHSHCGMSFDLVENTNRASARQACAEYLRRLRNNGQTVSILASGEEWEAIDPDESAMVSDDSGILAISCDDSDSESDCYYFVSILWDEPETDDSDSDIESETIA